jgi:uracil-DNA glycosylase
MMTITLVDLLNAVRQCRLCEEHLPLGPNPIVRASETAQILIIGQAPGTKVHQTSIPWDDPSGKRLREWMSVSSDTFYDEQKIAIMPMGFCYPGKGKSGDLPPRKECANEWHQLLRERMPNIELTLLIGQYAQKHYLNDDYKNLTERVKDVTSAPEGIISLPHPSPRNQIWLKRNPWFEETVIPHLQAKVNALVKKMA